MNDTTLYETMTKLTVKQPRDSYPIDPDFTTGYLPVFGVANSIRCEGSYQCQLLGLDGMYQTSYPNT